MSTTDQNSSIEIITYELAQHIAPICDIIVYAKKGRYQKEFEYDRGVQYRRISVVADEWHTFVSLALDRLEKYSFMYSLSRIIRQFFFFRNVKRPFFASPWFYHSYTYRVAKSLQREGCDIVHIHNFSQIVPIVRAFNPKIKIVLHMHCEWLTQLDKGMIQSRLERADLIIGVSDFITKKIKNYYPMFAGRCRTLLNAADIHTRKEENPDNNNHKKNGVELLLTVGRVSPEKGIHVLIEAFKKVLENYPSAQLEIIGWIGTLPFEYLATLSDDQLTLGLAKFYQNRDYFSYLESQLSLSERNHVSFLGELPHKLIPNYYGNADIYVSSSVCNEPGNVPVIEAMAAGIPVVATRKWG